MVMNLDLVCMVCQCNVYVIPESVSRKDLGYKCFEAQCWDRFRLAALIRIGESDARSAGALLTRWRIQNDVQAGTGDDLAGFDSLFCLRNRLRGGQSRMA